MNINKLLETNYDIEVKGICCNSAQAQPGDVFVAVTGFKTDGHKVHTGRRKRRRVRCCRDTRLTQACL